MFRRAALATCLALSPFLLGPLSGPGGAAVASAPATTPDLVATWFRLWGQSVCFDETWLLRTLEDDAGVAFNCNGGSARLRVVAEQRVTGLRAFDEAPVSFVGELEQGGFSTFAVGVVVETPRGSACLVGLDIRDAETSFLVPYLTVEEAGLSEVTGIVAAGLQRRGSPPARGAALAAFR
ncbi:MAG TPA: hypothetical protein VFY71_15270 [Planctomycetota bacterium]|nr:hypothetical protein [Planctomycetota bacterium]